MSTPDILLANSANTGALLRYLPTPRGVQVGWVHELGYALTRGNTDEDRQRFLESSDHFIAASKAVKAVLRDEFAISPERIDVCYEFVDISRPTKPADVRAALSLPASAPIVLGAGTMEWRKAPDLFVQVAAAQRHVDNGVQPHFVWVGRRGGPGDLDRLLHDARLAGVADHVHFPGETDDMASYFAAADVFLLTSREDPFPLVCLEAASFGLPVVTFRQGGMPEFVRDDAGFVVDYLAVDEMARRTLQLLAEAELRQSMGAVGRRRVETEHSVEVGARRVWDVVSAVAERKTTVR